MYTNDERRKITVTKDVKRIVAGKLQNLSVKVAAHYANVACPILTYQPKMSEEVKKLRKF